MKKTDIAMIVFIASLSVMISYFVTKTIMGDATSKPVQVDTATALTAEVEQPDKAIFNSDAINPTVEVLIGKDGNTESSIEFSKDTDAQAEETP